MSRFSSLRLLRYAMAGAALCAATAVSAATITVDALADDVFPDATGALYDAGGAPVLLLSPKCTLRMAISSANLDPAVGIPNGCVAGSGADTIVFAGSLTLPGTITLADKGMSEQPATYTGVTVYPALIASRELTITGPGSAQLTIDGSVAGLSGRRMLNADDGDGLIDRPFTISGVRLLRGRTINRSAGCMFSAESTTITDVIFESCESVGGYVSPTDTNEGYGGALVAGNTNTAGNYRPSVTISSSLFVSNRATRGTNPTSRSEAGAAGIGSGSRNVGAVSLTGVRVLGNSAEQGGGMYILNATSVLVTQSQFLSNVATGSPNTVTPGFSGGRYGGLNVSGIGAGGVTITNSGFVSNAANLERGGFSVRTVAGTVTINDVMVLGNLAVNSRIGGFEVLTDNFDAGGTCLGTSLHPVSISNVDLKANMASTSTAGFRVQCSGTVSITDTNIEGNEVFGSPVAGSGGNSAGQVLTTQAVTMTNVRVTGNKTYTGAVDGGTGVLLVQDNASFTGSKLFFRDNYAQQSESGLTLRTNGAGRIYTLADSAFVDNGGGTNTSTISALQLSRTGNYTVRNSTFSGNASNAGGPIFVNMNVNNVGESTVVAFENVTSARSGGGNIALQVGGFGGAGAANGSLTVKNSILGSGTSGIGFASVNLAQVAGVTYLVTNSLIENSSVGVPAGICGTGGNLCNVDARLERIGANGGFPTLTHALKPGSPALDSGNSAGVSAFDQRGTPFPRIVGAAVDMGAFESPVLAPPCTLDVDGDGTPDALTDGLMIVRALFGLTGSSVTTGVVAAGAPRNNWTLVRNFLNGSCGANFSP